MKKLIVDVAGKENMVMNFEEVMAKYERYLDKQSMRYNLPGYGSDDVKQECNISLWEAFNSYDERNAFVVHLKWCIKDRMANLTRTLMETQKRGNEFETLLSLDYEDDTEEGTSLMDSICDEFDLQSEIEDKELLDLIFNLAKDEIDEFALQVLLGNIKNGQAAEMSGASKHLINTRCSRIKKRLTDLLISYNPINRRYLD